MVRFLRLHTSRQHACASELVPALQFPADLLYGCGYMRQRTSLIVSFQASPVLTLGYPFGNGQPLEFLLLLLAAGLYSVCPCKQGFFWSPDPHSFCWATRRCTWGAGAGTALWPLSTWLMQMSIVRRLSCRRQSSCRRCATPTSCRFSAPALSLAGCAGC